MKLPSPFLHSLRASTINVRAESSDSNHTLPSTSTPSSVAASYDYVVIGGGTGGLAVAARLAESGNNSVAVIEAGGLYEIESGLTNLAIPASDVYFVGSDPTDTNPLIDWSFVTTPQLGADNRELHYARGKTLGGSSSRNFMIYQRGTTQSYQQWADAVGDQSYQFENFQPYFEKSITFTPPNTSARSSNATVAYNSTLLDSQSGPIQVSYPSWSNAISSWVRKSFKENGIDDVDDFNSGDLLGSQYCSTTIDPEGQTRSSSETGYLREALASTSLKVYPETMAKKIIFNAEKAATGVTVSTLGIEYTLTANKEVIVSAGAFQSPQMLMVSGIGPEETLQQHNIPIVHALPGVGQNMWDHVFMGPSYQVNLETHSKLTNPLNLAAAAIEYLASSTGMLTNNEVDYLAWEKLPASSRSAMSNSTLTSLATFPSDWPELEYLVTDGYQGYQRDLILGEKSLVTHDQYATIAPVLVAPLSRGNVTIISADTSDLPIINPNWLSDLADQEVALQGYKRARQFWTSESLRPVIIGDEAFPGPNVTTDDQIMETIRQSVSTIWHAACTCKMGTSNDPMAVVDSKAKVFGVTGLRVVDASAFPILPPGHPQSTIYALAEKIADDILQGE